MQVSEMRMLRMIKRVGVTKLDRVRDDDVRNVLIVENIQALTESGQLRWFFTYEKEE